MTNETIIEADALTRRFRVGKRTVDAVTDLSFRVGAGELVAFLGPNGAGKSTSLRMLTTLLAPTSGTARVVGHDILREQSAVRRRIGYVGQLTSGSHAQRARDELLSQGAFTGMSREATRRRADELIDSLDLASFAHRTVQQLSGGQKRRLDVALGLMHSPPLLFLDEPSTGLDPQSRANLWDRILELREQRGTTVFVTTHYLEEADRFAERVMVMDQGRVIADDTAAALKAERAGDVLTFGFADPVDAAAAVTILREVTGAAARRDDDVTLALTVHGGDALLPEAIRRLASAGIDVRRATGVPPTLDDVFLALTGRSLRDAGEGDTGEEDTGDAATDRTASDVVDDDRRTAASAVPTTGENR